MDGDVEIGQMGIPAVIQENVVRFDVTGDDKDYDKERKVDIPMHDVTIVKIRQSRRELSNVEANNIFRKRA